MCDCHGQNAVLMIYMSAQLTDMANIWFIETAGCSQAFTCDIDESV